jgi:hypothetical protein
MPSTLTGTTTHLPFGGTVDLHAEPPPIDWAVHGFAARGTLTLLAAPTGAGKTWLALQLAEAVTRGAPTAGMQCQAGRALYLDAENGPAIIGRRLRDAGMSRDALDYIDMRGRRIDRPHDRDELVAAIRKWDAAFVVLDSLRRLAPDAREDSSDDMASLIGGLANVARLTDAAIVLQHHRSTKGGAAAVRGSSAIEDQADTVFSLTRTRDPAVRQLAAVKFRLGPEPDTALLRFQDDPPSFISTGPSDTLADTTIGSVDALADRVRADGSWTTRQIGEAIGLSTSDDGDRKRLGRAMAHLVNTGSWSRLRQGVYAPAGE